MVVNLILSLSRLCLPLISSSRNMVYRCEETLRNRTTKKRKHRKPKRVTFEDSTTDSDSPSNQNQLLQQERRRIEPNFDTFTSSESSDSDWSDDESSEFEMVSHLDLLNIRKVHLECVAKSLMRKNIADGQARLDEAKGLLATIPDTMSAFDRQEHVMHIFEYVGEIFASMEKSSLKLLECHDKANCEAEQDYKESVKRSRRGSLRDPPPAVEKPQENPSPLEQERSARRQQLNELYKFILVALTIMHVLLFAQSSGNSATDLLNDKLNSAFDVASSEEVVLG